MNTRIARLDVERKTLPDGSIEYLFTIPGGVFRDRQTVESRNSLESNYLNEATRLRRWSTDGPDPTAGEYSLSALGEELAQRHIPREVREYLFGDHSPLVIETNDPEFPWELVHYRGHYLGVVRLVGRLAPLRRRVSPGIEQWGRQRRALLVGNPGNDLPVASQEIAELKAWLRAYREPYAVETLEGHDVSWSRLSGRLQSGCEFLHFAGHVTYDEQHHGASGLRCADGELLDADTIRGSRGDFAFAFVNGCMGGRAALTDAEAIFSFQLTGPRVDGLAAAFMEAGASAFISALWPVVDTSAHEFASAFYRQALTGVTFGEALRWTRETWLSKRPNDPSWASYVLYGNPLLTLDSVRDPSRWNDQVEQAVADARVQIPTLDNSADLRLRHGSDRVEQFFRRFVRDETVQLEPSGYDALAQTLKWIDSQNWPTVARLDLLVGLALVPESHVERGLRALGSSPTQLSVINRRVFGTGKRTADQPNFSDGVLSALQRAARLAERRNPAQVTAVDIAEGLLDLPTTGSLHLGLQAIGCDGRMLLAAARGEPVHAEPPPRGERVQSMAFSQADEIGHKRDATARNLLVNLRAEAERAVRGSGVPPFVDRGPELREALTILSRNDHHHLMIHGPAGVGRRSLVAHIAFTQVIDPQASEIANVSDWEIYAARIGHNTPRVGDRLRKELSELPGPAIVVMEDVPNLLHYPAVPEILRDVLHYATLRLVATATTEGYLHLFARFAPLAQLFVPLEMTPPRPERAIQMVQAHVQRLERRYRVTIAPDAAESAVRVAHEEQPLSLPGAAITRLERACARAIGHQTPMDRLEDAMTVHDGLGGRARWPKVTSDSIRHATLTAPDEAEGGDRDTAR